VALLAGGSVIALSSAAMAQTPLGLVGESTVPQILVDGTGAAISGAGNVDATGKVIASYQADTNYGIALAGTGGNANEILVDSTGKIVTVQPAGYSPTGAAPAGYSWAASAALDPNIKFVQPTYGNETYVAPVATATNGGGGNYFINTSTGVLANPGQLTAAGITGASTPAQIAAAGFGLVSPTATDPKATFAELQAEWQAKAIVNHAAGNIYSLTPGGTPANQTYTPTGGDVFSNSTSQATTAGPGGVQVIDLAKGTSTLTASSLAIQDGTAGGHTSQVTASGATFASPQGSVTIASDPSVTVATPQSTAQLSANGNTAGVSASNATGAVQVGVNGTAAGLAVTNANGSAMVGTLNGGAPGFVTIDGGGHTTFGVNGATGDLYASNSVTTNTVNASTVNAGTVKATTVKATSVQATVLSTEDSHGLVYANVGDALTSQQGQITSNTAGIANLNSLYHTQQGEINAVDAKASKALQSAAVTAALPQLHFANGDWLSVGVGGADAGGSGAWALAAGALVQPNIMVGIKGGMSGNTGVIAASGSWSIGGRNAPLK
jgi:hypothetical protein